MILAVPNERNLKNWPQNEGQVIEVLSISELEFEGTSITECSGYEIGYYSDTWITEYHTLYEKSVVTIPLIL